MIHLKHAYEFRLLCDIYIQNICYIKVSFVIFIGTYFTTSEQVSANCSDKYLVFITLSIFLFEISIINGHLSNYNDPFLH